MRVGENDYVMGSLSSLEISQPPPRSGKKHQAILDAATDAFLDAGYGAATMDDIAVRAAVSKQTIYNHFGSKEDLFAAIVEARCEHFLAPIIEAETNSGDLAETLRALGRDFLARVLQPSSLALHRLLVAESARFPELGRLSYEAGPRRVVAGLARLLRAQADRNALSIPDPERAAEQFYGALLGFVQLRAILCDEPESGAPWIDAHVQHAVAVFLAGHRQ